jgi:uncharacterized protein (DUF1778 family)
MAKKKTPKEKMILVSVRMTREQYDKIVRAAKAGKESFSAYVRRVCGVNP